MNELSKRSIATISGLLKGAGRRFSDNTTIKNLAKNRLSDDLWRSNKPARITKPTKKIDSGRENATKALRKRLF